MASHATTLKLPGHSASDDNLPTIGENAPARTRSVTTPAIAAALSLLISVGSGHRAAADFLDIDDAGDNTIKHIDFDTGQVSTFGSMAANGLKAPAGIVIDPAGDVLVSNQNANTAKNGTILRYSPAGDRLDAVVLANDKAAPAAPRGMILLNGFIYVADFSSETQSPAHKIPAPGRLLKYTTTGTLVGTFVPPAGVLPQGAQFHPRSVVTGPDGMLYISNFPNPEPGVPGLGGQVLRFDPGTGKFDPKPFISSVGGPSCDPDTSPPCNPTNQLNRPEGLVFSPGPDFSIYITSFIAEASDSDSDKIIAFQGPQSFSPGAYIGRIDLGQGTARAFAQALLFGPDGALFVPISGGAPSFAGTVRKYDVSAGLPPPNPFVPFVPQGVLVSPQYLTFGKTDPATLAYPGAGCLSGDPGCPQ